MALPNRIYGAAANAPRRVETEPEGVGGDSIADAYRLGIWGQVHDAWEREVDAWQPLDPDFDVRKEIPAGYEAYAPAYAGALNRDQVATITAQIDENQAIRLRREERGTADTVTADLIAGVFDPLNLVPAARLRGAGLRAGTAKGAITIGGLGAATEVVRTSIDPTATYEEGAYGAAGSVVLGGIMGGVIGKITGRAAGTTAARAIVPASIPAPVASARVTSRFGRRRAPVTSRGRGSSDHPGVDLATPLGTPVVARRDATVIATTTEATGGGYGISVTLDLGGGVTTKVAHLSRADVQVGQKIKTGTVYARTGSTGKSTGPHLHYELRVNGKPVDPFGKQAYDAAGGAQGAQASAAREGLEIPQTVEINGRGVPVVVVSGEGGAPARFVRGKTASQVSEEVFNDVEAAGDTLGSDTGLAEMGGNMASGIGESLRASLLKKVEDGITRENGQESTLLQVAKKVKDRGGTVTADILERIQQGIDAARGKPGFHKAMYEIVDAIIPPPLKVREVGGRVRRGVGEARQPYDLDDGKALVRKVTTLRERADAAALRGEDELADALDKEADDLESLIGPPSPGDAALASRDATRARLDSAMGKKTIEEQRASADRFGSDTRETARDRMRSSGSDEADELPFGMQHGETTPHLEDGDHFRIDVEAILSSFSERPWTRSHIEGIITFPEDEFANANEWLDFVVNHEIEHSVNPQREGESLAAYENRINARALEQLRAGQRPFSPSKSWMEKAAVYPTPRGQAERLLEGHQTSALGSLMELADDFAVQSVRGQGGGPTAVGGSVFQRIQGWLVHQYDIRQEIRTQYLKLVGMPDGASRFAMEMAIAARKIPGVRRKLGEEGLPTLDQFRREVARAIVTGEGTPHAMAAAAKVNEVNRLVEQQARELGLFQSTRGLQARASHLERQAARIERSLERVRAHAEHEEWFPEMEGRASDLRLEAQEMRGRAEEAVMPHREANYFHRIWNVDALRANEAEILEILRRGYARQGHDNPEFAARGAYDLITQEPSGEIHAPGAGNSLRHRSIPVTNAEAFDFIVQDVELVQAIYLRRVGASIEMTRSFGDPGGLGEIDALRAEMLAEGVPREKAEQFIQIWGDARDRIAGGFHGADPLSWSNRAVRAIKGMVSLSTMGGILTSQIPDIARTIGVVGGVGLTHALTGKGPAGLMGGMYAAFVGDISRFRPGGIAKEAGEALELTISRTAARMIESDDALLVTRDTAFERLIAKAQLPFFVMNGMIPFTVILKEWAAAVSAHNIIEEARQVARFLHLEDGVPAGENRLAAEPWLDGPRPSQEEFDKLVGRFGNSGMDLQDVQILATMPTERGKSGLHLANVGQWELMHGERGARARSMLLAAVQGEVRRAVTTPGPLDRPAIFDGIFHTVKGREEGLQRIEAARQDVLAREAELAALRGRADDDPVRVAALEAVGEARGAYNQARRNQARAGRYDNPWLSLPFQIHAFAMASGSKVLHGLLTGRDRAKLSGYLSLIAAGMLVTWLKAGDYFEKQTWGEFITQSFDNSGVGAWMLDLGGNVDQALDARLFPGNSFDREGERFSGGEKANDQAGAIAPAAGLAAKLIEPFVNSGLEDDDRVRMIRRALPFNNLVGLSNAFDLLEEAAGSNDYEHGSPDEEPPEGYESEPWGGGRFGATVPDLRTGVPAGADEAVQPDAPVVPPEYVPTPAVKRKAELEAGLKGKKKRKVNASLF